MYLLIILLNYLISFDYGYDIDGVSLIWILGELNSLIILFAFLFI